MLLFLNLCLETIQDSFPVAQVTLQTIDLLLDGINILRKTTQPPALVLDIPVLQIALVLPFVVQQHLELAPH